MNSTEETARAAYIAGLRQLADTLEQHPEVGLPINSGTSILSPVTISCGSGPAAPEILAASRRAFGAGSWTKDVSDSGNWLNLKRQLAGLHVELYAARDSVCTRRVVGTEEREVEVEVTPAVKEKRTETVEVIEWVCAPILGEPERGEAPAS